MVSWYTNTAENIKAAIRSLRATYFSTTDIAIEAIARLIRRKNYVRHEFAADDPHQFSKSASVYVHYDNEGVVFDYVIYQLKELMEAGFRITFVSNSPKFPDQSRHRVAPYCRTIIWRSNVGYDFGAYKDGIAAIPKLDEIDQLILMNDSVYGPFQELKDTLAQVDPIVTDYWGIVSSWEGNYHLQTFFLVFYPRALRSTVFHGFWKNLPYVNNKWWVIRNGEMRLNYLLARAGLRSYALINYWSVAKAVQDRMYNHDWSTASGHERDYRDRLSLALLRGRPVNPMHFFWDIVVTDYQCPFMKRELIQINPAQVPFVDSWADIIRQSSDYDIKLITDHQKELRNRLATHQLDK